MQLIYDNSLTHHGILGQKWGVRRYQPYPAGHKGGIEVGEAKKAGAFKNAVSAVAASRIANKSIKDYKSNKTKANSKAFERTIKQGKDKPTISPAEKIAKDTNAATQEAIRAAKDIMTAVQNNKPKKNRAREISDAELRDRINRLRMEREYNSLTSEEVSKGYETAMQALTALGSVASIALSGVGIYATIRSLKNGG